MKLEVYPSKKFLSARYIILDYRCNHHSTLRPKFVATKSGMVLSHEFCALILSVIIQWYCKSGDAEMTFLMHLSLWQEVLLAPQGHREEGKALWEEAWDLFRTQCELDKPLYLMHTSSLHTSTLWLVNVLDIQTIKNTTIFR